MERLWGEVAPVPERNLIVIRGGETIEAGGRSFEVAYTPGHASHHVCYFDRSSGIAFVGDTAGVCVDGGYVLPPTPPPDIDVELWLESIQTIDRWRPSTLFLTHFGPITSGVPAHLQALADNLQRSAALVRESLAAEGTDEERKALTTKRDDGGIAGADAGGAGDGLRDGRRVPHVVARPGPVLEKEGGRSIRSLVRDRDPRLDLARRLGGRRGFREQTNRVALGRAGGRSVRAHPVDRRQQLAAPEHGGEVRAILRGPLHLEVHDAVERNRRRHLALDERVVLADVASDDRREAQRAGGVPPRQPAGDRDAAAAADAVTMGRGGGG